MSERLKGRGHIVFAVVFTLLAAAVALWGGQWQAKDYKGKGLGLFVADGDTTTTGYLEADTAAVDTAHFLKASVHRLDGWRAGIDTVRSQIDSTVALYVNTSNTDKGYGWFENYTLNTASNFWGIYGGWYKKSGASNQNDYLNGMWFDVSMNQPGGVLGGLYGFAGIAELANGQMGTPDTSRYLMGGEARTNAVGGTLYGSMIGFFNEAIAYGTVDSITGDAVGTWVHTATEHVGGSTYGILLDDDTGTDWGIYQTGTSPNYLWGLQLGDSLDVAGNVHAAAYYGDGSNLTGVSGGVPDHIEIDYVGADTLVGHRLGRSVTAPYDDESRAGFMQGVADLDTTVIPTDEWWVGLDFRAELDNGPMTPYTRAMGADIGVTVYQDTGHVGAITGGQFSAQVSGGAGMTVGTASSKASGWGLIGTFSAYIDSIISGSGGSGGILAQAVMSTTKAPKVAALRTETSGGANVDTLVSIWMNESASNDWGIYQAGTAPNKLNGPIYTLALHADSLYGDGSNLTGVSGVSDHGALTGLEDNDHPQYLQAADFDDSLAAQGGGPGGVTDHGELDSLSLLDDDHPQYLLRADFPDSFATAWPDSFAAAMSGTIAPAIHDTAQAVRQEVLNSTSFPGAFWQQWWTAPGEHLAYLGGAGAPDRINSVAICSAAGTFIGGKKDAGRVVSYKVVGGAVTPIDSVTITNDGVAYTGWTSGDSCLIAIHKGGYQKAMQTRWVKANGDIGDSVHQANMSNDFSGYGLKCNESLRWCYSMTADFADRYVMASVASNGTITSRSYSNSMGGNWAGDAATVGGEWWRAYSGGLAGATTGTGSGSATEVESAAAAMTGVCIGAGGDYWFASQASTGKLYSYRRDSPGYATKKDSITTNTNGPYGLACDETHVFVGMTGAWGAGIQVAVIDTGGHFTWTDTLDITGTFPYRPQDYWCSASMQWDGTYLVTGTDANGIHVYTTTDNGQTTYSIRAAFRDSTLMQGPVAITADTLPTWPLLPGQINLIDGATESHASAGDIAWTTTSSRKLKQTNGVLGQGLGGAVLEAISRMPIYWWKWKRGDTDTQHVGPVAEDFYEVGKLVAPRAATDSTIAGEHEVAALFLAVKELARRNDSLTVALAASEQRMAKLERAWGARDSTGVRPRRPRLDKPPERPEPSPRPSKAGRQ